MRKFAAASPLPAAPTTPKIDVRGAVVQIHGGVPKVLLVQEVMDSYRWSLPGGWADIHSSPREMVERELFEETGYRVCAIKLIGLYDRRQLTGDSSLPCFIIDFLCEIVGGAPMESHETGRCDFFALDSLPELSLRRTQPKRLIAAVDHFLNRERRCNFD